MRPRSVVDSGVERIERWDGVGRKKRGVEDSFEGVIVSTGS